MKRAYFDKSQDLRACGLMNILVISMVHRIIGRFKRRNFSQYPSLSEIITACVAHRLFYIFDVFYNFRNSMRKINRRMRGSTSKKILK
jgi:hypothetical protein